MADDRNQSLDKGVSSVLDQPTTVDDRELSKPIQEYKDFHSWRENVVDVPQYKFRINSLRYFIQRNLELMGEEFCVPELTNRITQFKCSVNRDHFLVISIRFLKPFLPPILIEEIEPEFNPIITILITANDNGFRIKFCRVFPFSKLFYYGVFYPIFKISYESCVKRFVNKHSNKDSASLWLLVKNGFLHEVSAPAQGRLLWTVLVSHLNLEAGFSFEIETQMGLSPFIRGYELGILKVQLRLFLIGKNVAVERRYFNQHFILFPKMKCVWNFSFVHPNYPKKRVNIAFEDLVVSYSEKTARASLLFPIDQLVAFISDDNKLQIQVDIREYLAEFKELCRKII